MSEYDELVKILRDGDWRHVEAADAIAGLVGKAAGLNIVVTGWMKAFDEQEARAEAAEAEVERLKGVLEEIANTLKYAPDDEGVKALYDFARSVAGGSSRDASKATEASGARCATPCASAPATDPIRDAVAMARGRVLVVDDIPMLNKLAAAMKPATKP